MYILHIHKFTKSRKPRTYGGNIIYNILPLSAALVVHSSGLRGAATTVPLGTSWQQKKGCPGSQFWERDEVHDYHSPLFFANIITILLRYMPVHHTSNMPIMRYFMGAHD